VRDTAALPLDMAATSLSNLGLDDGGLYAGTALGVVDTRAGLLGASNLMEQIALDPYTFLRDAYLARRRNLVYDGNPPPLPDDEGPGSSDPAR
jgi:phospholipid-binding lipoprotein MlaA